jgi:hypothetical protein
MGSKESEFDEFNKVMSGLLSVSYLMMNSQMKSKRLLELIC